MRTILIAAAVALCAAVAVPAVAHQGKGKQKDHKPDVIALPPGFQPEGITTAKKHTFFVGSRDDGEIRRGSLRTGESATLVPGDPDPASVPDDRGATGLKVDRFGRLFVSGANSHIIRVYNASTGAEIRNYPIPTSGFINDVIVTKRGAYFTDSNNAVLYHVPFGDQGALGDLETITLGGDYTNQTGPGVFNANGIEAARGGQSLIVIKSNTGELFNVDAATGEAKKITVTGGDGELINGDGIMRKGRKLFVVENQDDANGAAAGIGVISVVKLSRNLTRGRISRTITSPRFEVPTTIARSGGRNYVVNAKFNQAATETTPYEVVKVPKK
jgi:sugar lactone lactonase YvrE